MFEKILCFGLCCSVKKIYRFKCGNHNKTENLFKKKNSRIDIGCYQDQSKKVPYGFGHI